MLHLLSRGFHGGERFLVGVCLPVGSERIQLQLHSASSALAHSFHLECPTCPDFWADSYSTSFAKAFTPGVIRHMPSSGVLYTLNY